MGETTTQPSEDVGFTGKPHQPISENSFQSPGGHRLAPLSQVIPVPEALLPNGAID